MKALWFGVLVLCLVGCVSQGKIAETSSREPVQSVQPQAITHRDVGFESRTKLEEHFHKHGSEFGANSVDEYLKMAQDERDKALKPPVEEIVRADGVASRFDGETGAFIAYNSDFTIRTCFKPNDGHAYFLRQAKR